MSWLPIIALGVGVALLMFIAALEMACARDRHKREERDDRGTVKKGAAVGSGKPPMVPPPAARRAKSVFDEPRAGDHR